MQNLNLVENLSMALSVFYMQVWFIYVIFFSFSGTFLADLYGWSKSCVRWKWFLKVTMNPHSVYFNWLPPKGNN